MIAPLFHFSPITDDAPGSQQSSPNTPGHFLSRAELRSLEDSVEAIELAVATSGGRVDPRVSQVISDFAFKVLKNFTGTERELIVEAAKLSAFLHSDQERIDGSSFVIHPFEVALTLYESLGVRSAQGIIAALLHDGVEDQAKRIAALSGGKMRAWTGRVGEKAEALNILKEKFGTTASFLIDKLTNGEYQELAKGIPELALERFPESRLYQAHIVEMYRGASPDQQLAFCIKVADFLKNLEGLVELRKSGRFADVVERLEDKRGGLSKYIGETIPNLSESHLLYKVRNTVAHQLDWHYRQMAKPGNLICV